MAIVQTVDLYQFREAFRCMDRQDQFSYEGFEALFDYLDNLSYDIVTGNLLNWMLPRCAVNTTKVVLRN